MELRKAVLSGTAGSQAVVISWDSSSTGRSTTPNSILCSSRARAITRPLPDPKDSRKEERDPFELRSDGQSLPKLNTVRLHLGIGVQHRPGLPFEIIPEPRSPWGEFSTPL